MVIEAFQDIQDAVLTACREVYGERLKSLAVFGSVARGVPRFDSDVDLLLIIDPLPDGRMARVREFEAVDAHPCVTAALAAAQSSGVRTTLSPVFKTPEELREGSLLFLDLTDQARLLLDRTGLLRDYLKDLARRLADLGARRIPRGGGYYWLLKPSLRPGEEISL